MRDNYNQGRPVRIKHAAYMYTHHGQNREFSKNVNESKTRNLNEHREEI